jgi:hypothetical protein
MPKSVIIKASCDFIIWQYLAQLLIAATSLVDDFSFC